MIKINLAPSEAREEIKNKKTARLFKQGLLCLLVATTIASINQLLLRNYLEVEQAELLGQQAFSSISSAPSKNKAQEINQQLGFFSQAQKERIYWSEAIAYLAGITPAGIRYFTLSASGKSLEISGEAEDRQSLLNYKKILESDQFLNSGEIPVKNLFQKEKIPFNVKLEIKSYDFPR
jgi:Tfp pilus assembly protein PilN